jgi:hypothetical protein
LSGEDARELTREFMQLLIRSYTTQLEEGYSILVVSPDFVADGAPWNPGTRESYRVKIVPIPNGLGENELERATA